jgi:ATP-dependent Clp protease, protease subunit
MHPKTLIKLLIDNAATKRESGVKQESGAVSIYVHDVIGGIYGGVDGQEIAKQMRELAPGTPVNVYINSPGGDVFEARAISAALMAHDGPVTGIIDGLAASAATDIACACDTVEISEGGFYMIHNAWTFAIGNKSDMLDSAALLEKIDNSIAGIYAKKTDKDEDYIKGLMDAETWMTAEEAKEAGFVDQINGKKSKATNWNLSAYAKAPAMQAPEQEDNDYEQAMAMRERRLALLERAPA